MKLPYNGSATTSFVDSTSFNNFFLGTPLSCHLQQRYILNAMKTASSAERHYAKLCNQSACNDLIHNQSARAEQTQADK